MRAVAVQTLFIFLKNTVMGIFMQKAFSAFRLASLGSGEYCQTAFPKRVHQLHLSSCRELPAPEETYSGSHPGGGGQAFLFMPSWRPVFFLHFTIFCVHLNVCLTSPHTTPHHTTPHHTPHHMLPKGKYLIADSPGPGTSPRTESGIRYLRNEGGNTQISPAGTQSPCSCSPYRGPTHTETP